MVMCLFIASTVHTKMKKNIHDTPDYCREDCQLLVAKLGTHVTSLILSRHRLHHCHTPSTSTAQPFQICCVFYPLGTRVRYFLNEKIINLPEGKYFLKQKILVYPG